MRDRDLEGFGQVGTNGQSPYAERDIMALDREGGHYIRHVAAMTRFGLHAKSDIAAELAHRDQRIAALESRLREVEKDAARLDYLDALGFAYGFEDMHEGNKWEIHGAYPNLRAAIDATLEQSNG